MYFKFADSVPYVILVPFKGTKLVLSGGIGLFVNTEGVKWSSKTHLTSPCFLFFHLTGFCPFDYFFFLLFLYFFFFIRSSSPSYFLSSKQEKMVMCDCGSMTIIRTSTTNKNLGRGILCLPKYGTSFLF